MGKLDGKVALITGGTSGIGAASAILFAREGASVVITVNNNMEGGMAVVKQISELGGKSLLIKADVSKEEDASRAVAETIDAFGKLDILFNNAGTTTTIRLHEATCEEFDRVIGVNLKAVFFTSK